MQRLHVGGASLGQSRLRVQHVKLSAGAGVAAGRAAGLIVVGVGEGAHAELLLGLGAERVVLSVGALLGPRLSDSESPRA
jgi:hypothetical protein